MLLDEDEWVRRNNIIESGLGKEVHLATFFLVVGFFVFCFGGFGFFFVLWVVLFCFFN